MYLFLASLITHRLTSIYFIYLLIFHISPPFSYKLISTLIYILTYLWLSWDIRSTFVFANLLPYLCMRLCLHFCVYVCVCICVHLCLCVCVYIYIIFFHLLFSYFFSDISHCIFHYYAIHSGIVLFSIHQWFENLVIVYSGHRLIMLYIWNPVDCILWTLLSIMTLGKSIWVFMLIFQNVFAQ